MSLPLSPAAKRILPLLDYTELASQTSAAGLVAFLQKALDLPVSVAAVCIRPEFVAQAKIQLAGTPIKLATVINFPSDSVSLTECSQNIDASAQAAAARAALATGADEIDLLFAYGAFQAGNQAGVRACVEAVKEACGEATLKVILESGAFTDMNQLRQAAELVVDAGADFLKTSSGVHATGATPEAVQVLCDVSRAYAKQIGIKISGGVRSLEQAQDYMKLVANTLGLNWIEPNHFRFGASKLVDALFDTHLQPSAVGY